MKYLLGNSKEEQNKVLEEFGPLIRKIVSNFNPGIFSHEDLYHEGLIALSMAIKKFKEKNNHDYNTKLFRKFVYGYVKVYLDTYISKNILEKPKYVVEIGRIFSRLDQHHNELDKKKLLKRIAKRSSVKFNVKNIANLKKRVEPTNKLSLEDALLTANANQEDVVFLKQCLEKIMSLPISYELKEIFLRWAIGGEFMSDIAKDMKLSRARISQQIKWVRTLFLKTLEDNNAGRRRTKSKTQRN